MSTSDDVDFVVYPNTIFTKITSAFITTSGTAFGGSALRVSRMTTRRRETNDDAPPKELRGNLESMRSREPWGGPSRGNAEILPATVSRASAGATVQSTDTTHLACTASPLSTR